MAFSLDKWARVSSGVYDASVVLFSYETTDSVADVSTAGYFDTAPEVGGNDAIIIAASDGVHLFKVSKSGSTLTASIMSDGNTLGANSVNATHLADNSVDTAAIQSNAVTSDKIAAGNISHTLLMNEAVYGAKVQNLGIHAGKYAAGSIVSADIANDTIEVSNLDTYATNDTDAGMSLVYHFSTPGGATANTDVTLADNITICALFVHLQADGTSGDTVKIQTGSGAADVSQAYDISSGVTGDNFSLRIIPPNGVFAAGAGLRINQVSGGGDDAPSLRVTLIGFKHA